MRIYIFVALLFLLRVGEPFIACCFLLLKGARGFVVV